MCKGSTRPDFRAVGIAPTAAAPTRSMPSLTSARAAQSGSQVAAMRNITFGGGCFWCTEAVFQQLECVSKVTPGYAGGTAAKPTYKQVVTGKTGHAEVVRVTYDSAKAQLGDLLDLFFTSHDPTTVTTQ